MKYLRLLLVVLMSFYGLGAMQSQKPEFVYIAYPSKYKRALYAQMNLYLPNKVACFINPELALEAGSKGPEDVELLKIAVATLEQVGTLSLVVEGQYTFSANPGEGVRVDLCTNEGLYQYS